MQLRLRPDELIGEKYRLIRPLGVGATGEVWSARNETTDREFALKILRADLATEASAVQRFLREAKAAGRLRHRNVIEVYDVGRLDDEGVEGGGPYLVMERLDGEALDGLLRRWGRLPLDTALRLVRDVAIGLDFAHRAGVVHRDLKPGNLFLHKDGPEAVVKILDFGISKLVGVNAVEGQATSAGTVLGSPSYMSPEQAIAKDDVDHRTDIWSLGVLLYKCISGDLPFRGETQNLLMMAITDGQPVPIVELVPQLPGAVARIIERCLEKNAVDRFASALDLARALDARLEGRAAPRLDALLQPATATARSLPPAGSPKTGIDAAIDVSVTVSATQAGSRVRTWLKRPAAYVITSLCVVAAAGALVLRPRATPLPPLVAEAGAIPIARDEPVLEKVGAPPDLEVLATPAPDLARTVTPALEGGVASPHPARVVTTGAAARRPAPPPARPVRPPPPKAGARGIDKPDF